MRLPLLPTLTPDNRTIHPEWHGYFERVYGEPVREPVDLNSFSFFYWFSPLGWWPTTGWPKEGEAWDGHLVAGSAEDIFRRVGFFVRRERPVVDVNGFLEVTRTVFSFDVAKQNGMEAAGLGEEQCAWFFVVRGSGVYVDLAPLAVDVYRDRPEWWPNFNARLLSGARFDQDADVADALDVAHLDAVIFTESVNRFRSFQGFLYPRAEMVVRLRNPDPQNSCAPKGLAFSTGWGGTRPCQPDSRAAFLNPGHAILEGRSIPQPSAWRLAQTVLYYLPMLCIANKGAA